MFSKKDTKIDEIFTVDLTLCSQGVALAREKLAGSIDGVVNIFLIVVF
jgi:hypothetical protein